MYRLLNILTIVVTYQTCFAEEPVLSHVMTELLNMKQQIIELQTTVREKDIKMSELQAEVNSLKTTIELNRQQGYVGFTAYNSDQYHVDKYQTIVFDTEIADYGPNGGNYDTSTGEFTCPADGLYYFTATGLSMDDQDAFIEIMIGSTALTTTSSPSSQNFLQGTNSVVTFCETGVKVSLECVGPKNCDFSKSGYDEHVNSKFSTFSGFLIALAS